MQARTIQLPGELHACALFCAVIAAVMAVLIRVLVPVIRPCFLKRGAPYSQAEMDESIEIWTRVVVGAALCACFPVCPLRRTHKDIARVCAGRTTRHCMLGFVCTTAALNLAASMPAAARTGASAWTSGQRSNARPTFARAAREAPAERERE